MNIAMLIIDMQKCFADEYPDRRPITEAAEVINFVSALVREGAQTVIHIKDVEDAGSLPDGQLEFIPEIDVRPSDLVVQKKASNAFWETNLAEILTERGIELVIMCGQAAEHCVVFTYNGAAERGFRPVILQNGVASARPGRVAALEQDRNLISWSAIQAMVKTG